MFAIDTGDTGGSMGPWISWTSEGSARKGFQPESWVLRGKDEQDNKFERQHGAFVGGCVLDLDSLKLGWEKDGGQGVAPERKWNASIAKSEPRPDDSMKPQGGYVWSRALSVRCAIGGGEAATWEQASFGAMRAFDELAKQLQAQHPGDHRLPLVKQTGVEHIKLKNGTAAIPVLTIQDWVERPDCLKSDAPAIDTGSNAAPAETAAASQAAQATASAASAEAVPAAGSF